jgi:carbamoyltransferase
MYDFLGRAQIKSITDVTHLMEYEVAQMGGDIRIAAVRKYNHHLTHAATAAYTSPFEEGACAVLDGYGEGSATACFSYKGGKLEEIHTIDPAKGNSDWGSLGLFYVHVCEACGFGQLTGEEWKVMGLAGYGRYDATLAELLRGILQPGHLRIDFCHEPRLSELLQKLYELRRRKGESPDKVAELACTGQRVFTEVLTDFLHQLHRETSSPNVILGGGCALNSSANGGIVDATPFESLHVFSAPADDGNAVGAALLAYYEDHPTERRRPNVQSPYLGSPLSEETLGNVVRFADSRKVTRWGRSAPRKAAELLAAGKIIGWLQGRAEFGPRALGNRSILADPRSPYVKDQINSRVKFREEFRPFAPSILHEFGGTFFESYQESPYMERTLRFKDAAAALVPGVVHVDGTGRLQTVKREWNQRFYELIFRFYELTGTPLVLNTSFNVMGKPIAHTVEDALAVLHTTGLDAVFLDDVLIEK